MIRKVLRVRRMWRNVRPMNRTPKRGPRAAKLFPAGVQPAAPVLKQYGAEREVFPYWKAQWFDPTTLAWRDVQEKHTVEADAVAAGVALKDSKGRARLMKVDRKGRAPLPEL
jgi:hypothetical protein